MAGCCLSLSAAWGPAAQRPSTTSSSIAKPLDYPKRHRFEVRELMEWVRKFRGMRVIVVGDLIVDE
jgi:hypothetical protein